MILDGRAMLLKINVNYRSQLVGGNDNEAYSAFHTKSTQVVNWGVECETCGDVSGPSNEMRRWRVGCACNSRTTSSTPKGCRPNYCFV